jgi:hypothetical protein
MLHSVLSLIDVRPVVVDADVMAAVQRATHDDSEPLPAMHFGHDARLRLAKSA